MKLLLTLIFVIVFCPALFALENVQYHSLILWDGFLSDIRQMFTDVLKEFWVFFLSLFFVWLGLETVKKILEEKSELHDEKDEHKEFDKDKSDVTNEEKQETHQVFHHRERTERNSSAHRKLSVLEDEDMQKKDDY